MLGTCFAPNSPIHSNVAIDNAQNVPISHRTALTSLQNVAEITESTSHLLKHLVNTTSFRSVSFSTLPPDFPARHFLNGITISTKVTAVKALIPEETVLC